MRAVHRQRAASATGEGHFQRKPCRNQGRAARLCRLFAAVIARKQMIGPSSSSAANACCLPRTPLPTADVETKRTGTRREARAWPTSRCTLNGITRVAWPSSAAQRLRRSCAWPHWAVPRWIRMDLEASRRRSRTPWRFSCTSSLSSSSFPHPGSHHPAAGGSTRQKNVIGARCNWTRAGGPSARPTSTTTHHAPPLVSCPPTTPPPLATYTSTCGLGNESATPYGPDAVVTTRFTKTPVSKCRECI